MEACRKFYGRAIERRKKGSLWKVPPFPPSHSFHRRLRPLASSIPNRVILGRYQSFCLVLLHLSAYQCFVMRREDLIEVPGTESIPIFRAHICPSSRDRDPPVGEKSIFLDGYAALALLFYPSTLVLLVQSVGFSASHVLSYSSSLVCFISIRHTALNLACSGCNHSPSPQALRIQQGRQGGHFHGGRRHPSLQRRCLLMLPKTCFSPVNIQGLW
jgi:hypothetical protein